MVWKLKQDNETEKDQAHNNHQYFNQQNFKQIARTNIQGIASFDFTSS